MAQSSAAVDVLFERLALCANRTCHIAECNEEGFRQLAAQAQRMTPGERRAAVMDDLRHQQMVRNNFDAKPYKSRHSPLIVSIAGAIVCDACYAECYGVTVAVMRRLKVRVRSGDDTYHDRRVNNGNNRFHTKESFADANELVDQFFDHIKRVEAFEIPDSARTIHACKPTHVLPITITKFSLYDEYLNYAGNEVKVGYDRFMDRWSSHHTEIVRGSKKTAYCDVCFQYKVGEKQLSDAEKLKWSDHLNSAAAWRALYRADIVRARSGTIDMLCIDKAESMRAPKNACEQPSGDYFKSGLRISMNGVADMAEHKAIVHVANESQTICKNGGGDSDADFVLSCLWAVISRKDLRPEVVIQADNCTAQNKNNYVLKFAAYLIDMGYCTQVSVNFMMVGHTKFVVDGVFGGVKSRMKRELYSEESIINSFPDSDEKKETIHIHAAAAPTWYAWRNFLHEKYGPKPLAGILSYQQFLAKRNPVIGENNVVFTARMLPTDEYVPFAKLTGKPVAALPNELPAAGVDAKRVADLKKFFPTYNRTPFFNVCNNLKVVV